MLLGIVRYAVSNAFMNTNKSRNVVQLYEEPYFSDRFNIFKNITLKSFENQTNKDFTLLVYHTNLIPADKKRLFDELEEKYSFMRNVYVNDTNLIIPDDLKTNPLFTFRIDNDDGIASDFIHKLKSVENLHKSDVAITIPHIHKICRIGEDKYKIVALDYVSNSIGLAYLSNGDKTVIELGDHSRVAKIFDTISLDGNGGLQTINSYNVANKFKHNADRNRSEEYILDQEEVKQFLIKEKYGELDITCLPIIK